MLEKRDDIERASKATSAKSTLVAHPVGGSYNWAMAL
jgi:hypothetical protein